MTEHNYMIKSVAPLRNVSLLLALIHRVQERAFSLPGMATFHGPSGYGKSTALVYASVKTGAIAVQVQSAWTRKTLCEAILTEMGLRPEKNIPGMTQQICRQLAQSETPLIIDEADHLMKTSMIELVRDFYEGSHAPVILIGEEQMPQKLRAWERVHNRMLAWVAAEAADAADARHLAGIYAAGVEIADDALAHIVRVSEGNTRRVCVNLEGVREFAAERGLERVDATAMGAIAMFRGEAPLPRFRKLGGAR